MVDLPPGPSSPRSDRVRWVRSLSQTSGRRRHGVFVAEGPQSVRSALHFRGESIRAIYVTASAAARHPDLLSTALDAQTPMHHISDDVAAAMSDTATTQGWLAICEPVDVPLTQVVTADCGFQLVAVLAGIRDPGNAGTVIRAADAAGASAVVVTRDSVDVYHPRCVRASAGSIFHLPVITGTTLAQGVAGLGAAGLCTVATTGAGTVSLPELDLAQPVAWIFGNEAQGLTAEQQDAADLTVRIPLYGHAESLNVAMAAAVCLYASAMAQRPS